jgi:hypothetical protein
MHEVAMLRRHFAITSLLVALPFAACECEDSLATYRLPGALAGVMCDLATGQPLAGNVVSFHTGGYGELSTTTDEQGAFLLEDLAEGDGKLVVSSGGVTRSLRPHRARGQADALSGSELPRHAERGRGRRGGGDHL